MDGCWGGSLVRLLAVLYATAGCVAAQKQSSAGLQWINITKMLQAKLQPLNNKLEALNSSLESQQAPLEGRLSADRVATPNLRTMPNRRKVRKVF